MKKYIWNLCKIEDTGTICRNFKYIKYFHRIIFCQLLLIFSIIEFLFKYLLLKLDSNYVEFWGHVKSNLFFRSISSFYSLSVWETLIFVFKLPLKQLITISLNQMKNIYLNQMITITSCFFVLFCLMLHQQGLGRVVVDLVEEENIKSTGSYTIPQSNP